MGIEQIITKQAFVPNTQNILDTSAGIYTPREVAFYANMHPSTLRAWLKLNENLLKGGFLDDFGKYLTFEDLIQAIVIRELRTISKNPISLQKIREAVGIVEQEYGLKRPFAHKHFISHDGKDLFLRIRKEDDPIQLTGRHKDQKEFKPIHMLYAKDIQYDTKTGLALEYIANSLTKSDDLRITINPKFRFGEPILKKYGITAESLFEAYQAEGALGPVAEWYEIPVEAVETAVRYWENLAAA